jgi:hypothetical protein
VAARRPAALPAPDADQVRIRRYLKAAKAPGLTVLPTLLALADEVIE